MALKFELWVIDQNNSLTVLIHNFKTAWPTKISVPFLSSLDYLLLDACIILQKKKKKKCWQFWDNAQNMLIFD